MICNLCLEDKPLLRHSHIIPDFMYQLMFDDKHFLHRGAVAHPENMKRVPTGEYEGDLLCHRCDNEIIGEYESYASVALFGGDLPAQESPIFAATKFPDGLRVIHIEYLNYSKFNLFLLSVLWRASITSRDFFRNVKLGADSEESIRQMLLNGKAGDPFFYPILMVAPQGNNLPRDVIGEPHEFELDGTIGYNFLMIGINFIYFIGGGEIPDYVLRATINDADKADILLTRPEDAERLFLKYFGLVS